ncbi:hypothetical protein [Streptomyces sp. AB3(2024)]|uniref:hypothetical protein n=1 Tax=Streptomyces sp. AB3(2024) TaxID=3317321 RepID=UPI0035A2B2C2
MREEGPLEAGAEQQGRGPLPPRPDADVPGGKVIARADVADALPGTLTDPSAECHAVGVAA